MKKKFNSPIKNIIFNKKESSYDHPNMMKFIVQYSDFIIATETYFSVGGGFIEKKGTKSNTEKEKARIPYPVDTASDMIHWCELRQKLLLKFH